MSNEQKIVDNKEKYIGGIAQTIEGGMVFRGKVTDITIEDGFFSIQTDNPDFSPGKAVGMWGEGKIHDNGVFHFTIPYIGDGALFPKS